MNNVPEQPPERIDGDEILRLALLDGTTGDLTGAAATLLTDIPGKLYADPAFQHYITFEGARAIVGWARLGTDMLAGALRHLPPNHRALLLIAASIGGGGAVPISLGALLSEVTAADVNLLIGALQHAVGVW